MLPNSNLTVDRRRPLGEHGVSPTSIIEDTVANNIGSGNIAGEGEVVKPKNKYKKANLKTTNLLRRTLKS